MITPEHNRIICRHLENMIHEVAAPYIGEINDSLIDVLKIAEKMAAFIRSLKEVVNTLMVPGAYPEIERELGDKIDDLTDKIDDLIEEFDEEMRAALMDEILEEMNEQD